MKVQFTIIGGGVAGLCASIRLAELGGEVVLVEGGNYPSHKVCGEFLSPECLKYLHAWNIYPVSIPRATFRTSYAALNFTFPSPAGGLSHLQLGPLLVEYAVKKGVQFRTQTQVTSFYPKKKESEPHIIELSTAEEIESSHVIIATGRIPNYDHQPAKKLYMGFKAHFKNIDTEGELEMFSFPGAYLGISPVEENRFNVACLASLKNITGDPQLFINRLLTMHPRLRIAFAKAENLFGQWMIATLPSFGIKQTPDWLDTYFIGDAAATIPPACGDGLAMGILGGRLAAEYAMQSRAADFKKIWVKRCANQIIWGKFLHYLMFKPTLFSPLVVLANHIPGISRELFAITRNRE